MTKPEIMAKLKELPELLQMMLLSLPHGYKASSFLTDQDILQEKFGDDWPTILGVEDDR